MNGTKLTARPWQPQDLLDDLQLMIDEQPEGYLNTDRETLCTAKAYLEEHFNPWISVADGLPETIACNAGTCYSEAVVVWTTGKKAMVAVFDGEDFLCDADYWDAEGEEISHWMPLRYFSEN